MGFATSSVAVLVLAVVARASHVVLDMENFEDTIGGKAAFVKFHAPWCGHCKRVKPVWKKLGDLYGSRPDIVIGDVDCTHADSKELCTKYGVRGFPTFKYFTDSVDVFGVKYEGDRTLDGFKDVVEQHLGPGCSLGHMDKCNDEQKEEIGHWKAMDKAHRAVKYAKMKKEVDEAEAEFESESQALEKEYEQLPRRTHENVRPLQIKYDESRMKKDGIVSHLKPQIRLMSKVMKDLEVHTGREEEF